MRKIWFDTPAKDWNEALPIGNGFLGGMIYGKPDYEIICLNEDSLWSGKKMNRNNPNCLNNLSEIRKLIFNGEINKAENLIHSAMSGIPEGQRHYQPLGNLHIDFNHNEYTNYTRELSMEDAIATVKYTTNNINYKREIFASYPQNIIAMRISADKDNSISFKLSLKRNRHIDKIETSHNSLIMTGTYGMNFVCCVKVITKGGNCKNLGQYLIIENADLVDIYLTAETEFRSINPEKTCLHRLNELNPHTNSKTNFETIKKEHITDYQNLFNRVSLNLGEIINLPTNKRLQNFAKGQQDNDLIALYFDFGRYLLISSSRPGSLPANLQGIWNDSYLPPWDSKYTININTEMNYWHTEICNLPELHMPLFDLLKRMLPNGKETAKTMYNCKGFVAHHNTDIWGDTAPQDEWIPATYWVMGGAWLCLHIWEHYIFTLDKDFLKEHYTLIREACEFFTDYLIEDNNHKLVTNPSVSPENTYILPNGEKGCICYAGAMDNQILKALFNVYLNTTKILDINDELSTTLKDILTKLYPDKIGSKGQLLEWCDEYTEAEPGHRHISHLFALYPGYTINPITTPELANAAGKTLELRLSQGGGHTGWSRAWIINMWARLLDGEKAYENLKALLTNSTLPNLFDNHPPFQIDGNFGGTAGITEMLLQSHTDIIILLPAIPKEWSNGNVQGLKCRGNITIDITWENHKVTKAYITSPIDGIKTFSINNKKITINYHSNKRKELIIK